MSSILVGRTRSRAQALQIIFQANVQEIDVYDLLDRADYVLEDGPLSPYAETLSRGVARNRLSIDKLIGGLSENWGINRMPQVDKAIMSIAIYEMFCEPDVDISVSINEAVEISKVFGTEDSPSFINGILGRVSRLMDEYPLYSLEELARIIQETPSDSSINEQISEESVSQEQEESVQVTEQA